MNPHPSHTPTPCRTSTWSEPFSVSSNIHSSSIKTRQTFRAPGYNTAPSMSGKRVCINKLQQLDDWIWTRTEKLHKFGSLIELATKLNYAIFTHSRQEGKTVEKLCAHSTFACSCQLSTIEFCRKSWRKTELITVNDKGSAVGRDKKGDESAALGIKIPVHTKATLIIIISNSASTVNRRRTKKRAALT